jgi:hypothetical protein
MLVEQDSAPHVASERSVAGSGGAAPHDSTLVRLVYRSRAALPLAGRPLADMLRAARRRNHRESVTGLLLADGSHYLQWLEGPPAGVATLMRSIALDRRHDSIEVLSDMAVPSRRFASWDMRLATDNGPFGPCAALHLPGPVIEDLWTESQRTPDLMAALGTAPRNGAERAGGATLLGLVGDAGAATATPWTDPRRPSTRIERDALDRLLAALADTSTPLDSLVLPGPASDARCLFAALIEPAARRLGDLWMADALSEIDVTIALGRLQLLVRQLGQKSSQANPRADAPAVLVAPMPGEQHGLGAVLASEWLWLSGWPHAFEIAPTDAALIACLAGARFDLLDLPLSQVFCRLDEAGALRRRLAAFRAASRNPALRIRLSGRLFEQQPWLAGLVGADAVSGSCNGLDAALLRLMDGAALG